MDSAIPLLKLLTALLTPLGFSLLLALLGLLVSRRWLVLIAVAWLWLWSTPQAAVWIGNTLAQQHPIQPIASLPTADVIVILGGGVDAPALPDALEPNLNAASDRLVLGAKLWHAGKAPWILYSGGSPAPRQPEAAVAAGLLALMGVPASAIVQEGSSRTTRENAARSTPLLRSRKVQRALLVSSSWHLPRAMANFRSAAPDIDWVAAACDPSAFTELGYPGSRWMPNSNALDFSRNAFKEWLGMAWARVRGP